MIDRLVRKVKEEDGAITIEAAIVMPLFIFTVLGIVYFMKVFFIQGQIDSALTRSAHEIAKYAVVGQPTGIIDLQQEIYKSGEEKKEAIHTSYSSLLENAEHIQGNINGVTDLSIETLEVMKGFQNEESVSMTLKNVVNQGLKVRKELPDYIDATYKSIDSIIRGIKDITEEMKSGVVGVGAMELTEFVNGGLSMKMAEQRFYSILEEEKLERWGVLSTNGYIDFSDSSFCLSDDTIMLVAKYQIQTPFISRIIEGVPIYQSVRVRAFTGAYDYDFQKKTYPKKKPIEDDDETIYYISTEDGVQCYHVYECLRKDLKSGSYEERVNTYHQEVCKYCLDHYALGVSGQVCFVSDRSKLHYTKECVKVRSKNIIAITKEEAEAKGYRTCHKKGCTHELHGQE